MAADNEVLESLAFLYLTFGHSTDGALTADEMKSLAGKLHEWSPSSELGDIGSVLKGAVGDYKGASDKLGRCREIVAELRQQLDVAQISKVLADLEAIAAADGNVDEAEKAFIEETRAALS